MNVMRTAPATATRSHPLTDLEFCSWVGQATPGDRLEYHRGFLGNDAAAGPSPLPETERRRLVALARVARSAFEAGLVHLVQLRLGPGRFSYVAVARTKPRRSPVALAGLKAA